MDFDASSAACRRALGEIHIAQQINQYTHKSPYMSYRLREAEHQLMFLLEDMEKGRVKDEETGHVGA